MQNMSFDCRRLNHINALIMFNYFWRKLHYVNLLFVFNYISSVHQNIDNLVNSSITAFIPLKWHDAVESVCAIM
jgi:hypothetical protein